MYNEDDSPCAGRSVHKYIPSQGNISENGQKYTLATTNVVNLGVPRPSAGLYNDNVSYHCIRVSLTTGSLMGHGINHINTWLNVQSRLQQAP